MTKARQITKIEWCTTLREVEIADNLDRDSHGMVAFLNRPLQSNQENDPYGNKGISFVVGQTVEIVGGKDVVRQTGHQFGFVTGFQTRSNNMQEPPVSFEVNVCAYGLRTNHRTISMEIGLAVINRDSL